VTALLSGSSATAVQLLIDAIKQSDSEGNGYSVMMLLSGSCAYAHPLVLHQHLRVHYSQTDNASIMLLLL
jgi:hypothetical protein